MVIAINNLPPDTPAEEISRLFAGDSRIESIRFSHDGNADSNMAIVRFQDMGRVELNRHVRRLNNHFYQNRQLRAYAPLFFR